MDPHLNRLQQEIESAIAGMSAEESSWHPPGKWSVAEILEHLYLTYTGTVKGLQRVVDAGRTLATPTTWKQRGRIFVVVRLGYMPPGLESPAVARPRGIAPEKVLAEILPAIASMDEIIRQCEARHGPRTKLLDHPILGALNGSQWRELHLVHGLHHGRQIRRLRQSAAGQPR
jgi:hypothetical protein